MRRYDVLILFGVITAVAVVALSWPGPSNAEKLTTARQVLDDDPQRALALAREVLESQPDATLGLQIAFDAAQALKQRDAAVQFLARLADAQPENSGLQLRYARHLLKEGRIAAAEHQLRQFMNLGGEFVRELATLYLSQGRREDARPLLFELVVGRQFTLDDLIFLGTEAEFLESRGLQETATKVEPDSAFGFLGLAALQAFEFHDAEAMTLYRDALERDTQNRDAWAGLGLVLLREAVAEPLHEWDRSVPESASAHPDIRFVRAQLALRDVRPADAIAGLVAVLRTNPNHLAACQSLGELLAQANHRDAAERLLVRARLLDETERLLHRVLHGERVPDLMRQIAINMERLDRPTEAWAWWISIPSLFPNAPSTDAETARLQTQALAAERQVADSVIDDLLLDLDTAPVVPASATDSVAQLPGTVSTGTSQIRLRDVGADIGLVVPYYCGLPPGPRGLWIYQGFGGGVAVSDFDRDGDPDLYFVHGNVYPPQLDDSLADNLCYMNRIGKAVNVTSQSGTGDSGFGQGVTSADFNQDGFPDLLIANIGVNSLLINNGDGTFHASEAAALNASSEWTTSVLMADINGDGLDDIYEVNYVAGTFVFEHQCSSEIPGQYRSCKPDLFPAAADRLLLSTGDGSFLDVTDQEGVATSSGRGLGIIACDVDGNGRLDMFVSNDMTANSLLLNYAQDPAVNREGAALPQLLDDAVIRGVAVNGTGRVEACMGIAAANFGGDSKIDFLVTNFFDETNTLYLQRANGFFTDATPQTLLADASRKVMGFGTQPIDLDNDADPDIIVLNGHVDDFSHGATPWKMLPQAFRNIGGGEFELLPTGTLGGYGETPQLGRALARIDWNIDGKPDVVATHLDRAPALLLNESEGSGNWARLLLVGTSSSRQAAGAAVRISTGEVEFTVQLMVGDGYYCSNERALSVGLGAAGKIQSLRVTWPSGREQVWTNVEANATWIMIEGRERLYELTDDSASNTDSE
jgi:tetratricopeptide (TPR) repeat protein